MMHFSCDCCGKNLGSGEMVRYVVKVEGFTATDPAELTEADLDVDHVEEMAQLLSEREDAADEEMLVKMPTCMKRRFDMCLLCYRKFWADPFGRESTAKFDFSEN